VTVNQKRDAIREAYSNNKWKQKVDEMPNDQVTAIYMRLKSQGKV
jgi:hypothetical protein